MYSTETLQLGGHADKNHYDRCPRGSFSQHLLFEREGEKKSHSEACTPFHVHLQYCPFFASPFTSPFGFPHMDLQLF